MSYYLEDHPNHTLPQYGWPRTRVSGVIGVHTTESGVFPQGSDPGAENTANYISIRDTYGSYHSLADWDSRIKLTRPRYAAWADTTNNAHALSVSGAMNAARWRDLTPERAAGIVRNMGLAAAELVLDAIADGLLDQAPPARRITAQQAIDGSAAGFYGHGETNPGTRYDPGQNFDWDLFLATYAAAIGGGITYQGTTTPQEDTVALEESDRQRFKEFMDDYFLNTPRFDNRTIFQNALRTREELQAVSAKVDKLPQALLIDTRVDNRNVFDWAKYNAALTIALGSAPDTAVDVDALADAIAARLPQVDAQALITALGERLAGATK